jgi:putative transcriptional regulator
MESFKNQLLLAMPHIEDPWFGSSLCLICEHSPEGAMGLILNKPLDITLSEVLTDLQIPTNYDIQEPVYSGGPVSPEQGFILHSVEQKQWHSTLIIGESICLTTSKDMLLSLGNIEDAPTQSLVILGYSGWSAGQLEAEIGRNDWLLVEADVDILFNTSHQQKLKAAADKIGIDLSLLTQSAGHA